MGDEGVSGSRCSNGSGCDDGPSDVNDPRAWRKLTQVSSQAVIPKGGEPGTRIDSGPLMMMRLCLI